VAARLIELGEGLDLREIDETLARPIFEAIDGDRERLGRWMGFVELTLTVEDELAFCRDAMQAAKRGVAKHFSIFGRGRVAGGIGFHSIQHQFRTAEVGYWLVAAFEGRGVMARALRAMLELAFDEMRLHRVQVRIDPRNARSIGVVERLGFRYEGCMRQAAWIRGEPFDCSLLAIVAPDWNRARI